MDKKNDKNWYITGLYILSANGSLKVRHGKELRLCFKGEPLLSSSFSLQKISLRDQQCSRLSKKLYRSHRDTFIRPFYENLLKFN